MDGNRVDKLNFQKSKTKNEIADGSLLLRFIL